MTRRRVLLATVAVLLAALVAAIVVRSLTEDAPSRPAAAAPRGTGGSLSSLTDSGNELLSRCRPGASTLASCGPAPAFRGVTRWFNTPGGRPAPPATLRGHVVLVEFLSYPCLSCVRHQPYVDAWYDAYRTAGLRVVGVESPEYDFEKRPADAAAGLRGLGVEHPVALDPRLATWTAYRNRYWPSSFLLDADGTVRAVQLGEGGYARTERQLRALLRQARPEVELPSPVSATVRSRPLPPTSTSPGVRMGWTNAEAYAGRPSRPVPDESATYTLPPTQPAETYGLGGTWLTGTKTATAQREARLRVRARTRTVDAVLGGTGTVTVTTDAGSRTVEVSGRPGLVGLLRGRETRDRTVDLDLSAGLRVYAVTYG